MSYNIGQLRRSEISSYDEDISYEQGLIDTENSILVFKNQYLLLKEANIVNSLYSYYLKFRVKQRTDLLQNFTLTLQNSEITSDNTEELKTFTVKQGLDDNTTFELIFNPNATYNQIRKLEQLANVTNVIVDNCHAFFSAPLDNAYNCYSTRKFFGVSDGAYLVKKNVERFILQEEDSDIYSLFLLSTIEKGTNAIYPENLKNEERLGKEVYKMSKLTRRVLESIDYLEIQKIRRDNMLCLHKYLCKYNKFNVNIESDTHMYYPLLVENEKLRQKLIQNHIYTPTWWRHVPQYFNNSDNIETWLSKYMLMIPIDQRYDESDMKNIAEIIINEIERN